MNRDIDLLEKLEKELSLKELQIKSLLTITQAINDNVPADGLFNMYRSFLSWEMGIEKMILFVRDSINWKSAAQINAEEDYNDELIAINNSFEIDDETFNVIDVIDYEGNIILRKEVYNQPFIDIVFTRDDSDIFFITSMVDEPDEMYNYEGELLKSDIQVFQKLYNDIYINFVNGVLAVEDLATNKIGFINESGDWEIEPQYDYEAEAFWDNNNYIFYSDGYAIVYKDGYYGVVNKQGEFLIDCVLETSPFSILDFCYEIMVPEISKDKY